MCWAPGGPTGITMMLPVLRQRQRDVVDAARNDDL
jgi:hypothetical protein